MQPLFWGNVCSKILISVHKSQVFFEHVSECGHMLLCGLCCLLTVSEDRGYHDFRKRFAPGDKLKLCHGVGG